MGFKTKSNVLTPNERMVVEINFEKDEQLVCEALVREIRDAKRWSAVKEAWSALLKVRQMAKPLIVESKKAQAFIDSCCGTQNFTPTKDK